MPNAVRSLDTQRFELKSLAGAFVELRRMSWGESVERRALMKMGVTSDGKNKDSFRGEMAMASREVSFFEFTHTIVSHNLEDATGRTLTLSNPVDFASLDPRVGQEIDQLISDMNNFEDEDAEN